MKQIKPIIWGIAIIALGLVFGGNALGLFNLNVFFDGWWTLFIIVPSVISLFAEKEKLTSLGFLAAGVILLLATQNVSSYDVAWKAILAVFLIIIVPDDVKVKLKSGFIFGGFSDERKNTTNKGKYTIYIDTAGGFGDVSITDKVKG